MRPRRRIEPDVGRKMPATHFSSVDFPEPLCPSRPTVSPWSTCRSMSRKAQKSSCVERRNFTKRSLTESAR